MKATTNALAVWQKKNVRLRIYRPERAANDGGAPDAAVRDALARLDAAINRHGDAARLACDRIAADLTVADALPRVQAANDDADPYVCRCPACEGCDDRGEGDA